MAAMASIGYGTTYGAATLLISVIGFSLCDRLKGRYSQLIGKLSIGGAVFRAASPAGVRP